MTIEFILGHFNYWIVIILMMTGLYIVVSRGNLIKKIVGLNLFQTSVFLLYITIGKVACGTAPIFPATVYTGPCKPAVMEHYSGLSKEAFRDFGVTSSKAVPMDAHGIPGEKISNTDLHSAKEMAKNMAGSSAAGLTPGSGSGGHNEIKLTEDTSHEMKDAFNEARDTIAEAHEEAAAHADPHGAQVSAPIIYSNPLPHVLILTAIVVGVATTALGLALAVRIREAYGIIEEDELQIADDEAEFGSGGSEAVKASVVNAQGGLS